MRTILLSCWLLFSGCWALPKAQAQPSRNVLEVPITLTFQDTPLAEAVRAIGQQYNIPFSFNSPLLATGTTVSQRFTAQPLNEVLDQLLGPLCLRYKAVEGVVVIFPHSPYSDDFRYVNYSLRTTITGQVVDQKTGLPMPFVHVFLANTMRGTYTDETGRFTLVGVPFGLQEVVASFVGYEPSHLKVLVRACTSYPLSFRLKEQVINLEEVVVSGQKDKNWDRYFQQFQRELLGTSLNSLRCSIENPYALTFEYDEALNQLVATAEEPLIIVNKGLGYRITYALDSFLLTDEVTHYAGSSIFEPLEPRRRREARQWRKARNKAYYGSFRHFVRALISGTLEQEGFELMLVDSTSNGIFLRELEEQDWQRLVQAGLGGFEYILALNAPLQVVYVREFEDASFVARGPALPGQGQSTSQGLGSSLAYDPQYNRGLRKPGQLSWLTISQPSLRLNAAGQNLDKVNIRMFGYWSFERLSETLPFEYLPEAQ